MINMRREAALALEEILSRGGYSSLTVKKRLRAMPESVGEAERRFFTSLVYTTLEHTISIDAIVGHYMKTPIAKLKPYVLSCLRLGLCQLRYMDGVPPQFAVTYRATANIGDLPHVTGNTVSRSVAPAAGAQIENMEGAVFFASCAEAGVPCAEIRAVSNVVGAPRGEWNIGAAVGRLAETIDKLF